MPMLDSDVLEFRHRSYVSGGLFATFAALLLSGVAAIPATHAAQSTPAAAFTGLFGGVALLVLLLAVMLFLTRGWTLVDRRMGETYQRWSVAGVIRESPRLSLTAFNRVRLNAFSKGGRRGGGGVEYVVSLAGPREEQRLVTHRDFAAARRDAERAALFLGLELHDVSTPQARVRAVTELNRSLAERRSAAAEPTTPARWPKRPKSCGIRLSSADQEQRFALPGWRGAALREQLIGLLALSALWAGASWLSIRPIDHAGKVFLLVAPLLVLIPAAVWFLSTRETVVASLARLRLERRTLLGVRSRVLDSTALEELHVQDDEIVARGDAGEIRFGAALSKAERRWLVAAIEHVLVHGVPAGGADG